MTTRIFLFLSILIFSSCGNNSSEQCQFGTPTPIFTVDHNEIIRETFSKKGQSSQENVQFKNNLNLEIQQSGCEHVKQTFRFHVPQFTGDFPDAVENISNNLSYFSNISEKYLMYGQWALAIEQNKSKFKMGNTVELAPHFNAKIDYIKGENPILILSITN